MKATSILSVNDLSIAFVSEGIENEVIKSISYDLYPNEILGIVGESGSGKSVSSLAVMGLLPKRISKITSGNIQFKGLDINDLKDGELQNVRGNRISMIFQEPMSSLNPSMTCGKQVSEILEKHLSLNGSEVKEEVLSLFNKVKLPESKRTFNSYPHEISGGQMQRVMIAMAIACKPDVLIADEPTTALDVTVQKDIIKLLKELQEETRTSILFITHDLSLISEIADRVMVMYKGEIVEQGETKALFKKPRHPYTKALISSRPPMTKRLKRLPTVTDVMEEKISIEEITPIQRKEHHEKLYSEQPLLEVINVEKRYYSRSGWFTSPEAFIAVDNVSFKIHEGETLGLVGESGCGKSTLGNAILQLNRASSGNIIYKGKDITQFRGKGLRNLRKDIQIIFQDPYASLNPRISIGNAILEPMRVHGLYTSDSERKEKVIDILEKVGLEPSHYNRYPHEFSGGQRQRIGIARTIAVNPKLIVCDESVSALDISVQAQVLNLLNELKEEFGFTYIFISHDLAVVKYMADQLVVMNKGRIEEMGDADKVYANPEKEYTKKLINAIPKGL